MMQPEFRVDMSQLGKGLNEFARRQLPFAASLALTATAGEVGVAWQDEMESVLDRPTPFTVKSVAVRPARKSDLRATVYIRDIAAEYLEPFVDGGPHFLGKKQGILAPKAVGLNAYGNLPRNKVASLKGKSNVYVGRVQLKNGREISGVWQRPTQAARKRVGKTGGAAPLKLLIRFSDPLPVTQRLRFYERAEATVARAFASHLGPALARAMASAR